MISSLLGEDPEIRSDSCFVIIILQHTLRYSHYTFQQIFFDGDDFEPGVWSTLEAQITLPTRNNMGLIIYENINGSSLNELYLDNIYFYKN